MASPGAVARTRRALEGRSVTIAVVGGLALVSVALLATASDAESGIRAVIRTTGRAGRVRPAGVD